MTLGLLETNLAQAGGSGETWRGPGYGRPDAPWERAAAVERAGWFRAAAAVRPRSVAAWNNLGVALKVKGDITEAIAAGRRALELDPKYGPAHNNLANSLYAAGDRDAARGEYAKAIELLPECPLARCNLGALLWQSGDLPAATKAFEGALQVAPDHTTARENLEKVRKGARFQWQPLGDEPLNRLPFKR
jgi:Flp pilus assembly protein TadD